jgi:hypothetical protein
MAKNGMASPQRVGREPPLDKPHERLTRPGQWVGRTGKREYLVGHRVVRAIPLHREALLTPLHVAGQGPEGEHVTNASAMAPPRLCKRSGRRSATTTRNGCREPPLRGPTRLVHLPPSDGSDGSCERLLSGPQPSLVVVDRVSGRCVVACGSHLRVGEGQGAVVVEEPLDVRISRFS